MSAALIGVGLVLFMLFSAGIDPWRWWLDYQRHTDRPSIRNDDRAGPTAPVSAVQPEPVGTDSSAAVSPAPLILKATRPGRNSQEGYADLGVNPASPQTYQAGAVLANGARIEEVYSDYIELARDAQSVRLYVNGRALASSAPVDSALLMVGGADPTPPALPSSTDELSDHIRVAPVFQGDVVHALEVYATQHSNVFSALGLEPGDRITSIDGAAVTDSAAAIAALRQLTHGAALQVTVERGGQPQSIALNGLILTRARQASTE
jgi:hypothetical protein